VADQSALTRYLFRLLSAVVLVYAFLSGLKTISEFDLGWQLATGRWIIQNHRIPSTEVLSYTATSQPWIYPVGAELIFYALFLIGGYSLLSWMTAVACAGVTALLLCRRSWISLFLATLAVPVIASRVTARAEMFTVVLFAATLALLWRHHESGNGKLWLLPLLMLSWVNLHPGFVAGLGLLGAYMLLEVFDLFWPDRRSPALARLRQAWPWLAATVVTTLANPWGWRVFQIVARQQAAMDAHSQMILEWAPIPVNWPHIAAGLSSLDSDRFYALLCVVIVAVPIALWRRQFGAAILMAAAAVPPLQHMRFSGLFSIVTVIVGSAVLAPVVENLGSKFPAHLCPAFSALTALLLAAVVIVSAARIVSNHVYFSGTNLESFGTGLSWWFPERAAAFIEQQQLPGRIFNSTEEGGHLSFRLGPKYLDYVDSRDIPFGTELLVRDSRLRALPPDSPQWKDEADRNDINVIVLPIGRFQALQFFPMLKRFCDSDLWRPIYLDEVSVVFLRRRPENEALIQRLQINCATAPLPVAPNPGSGAKAFNQWANAASVLHALGRDSEALLATEHALQIVPNSGYLDFIRGHIYQDAGNLEQAERDYEQATTVEPNLVAPWSALASFYQEHGRMKESINAWEHAADASRWPWDPLVSLGYANLQAHYPKAALAAFDRAAESLPAHYELLVDNSVLANINHGRARSYLYLGDLSHAIACDEEAARLLPDPNLWLQLATLYEQAGRFQDANRIRAQALTLAQRK